MKKKTVEPVETRWMVYSNYGETNHVIKAPGERPSRAYVCHGRPAANEEVIAEQARRVELATAANQRAEFDGRPDVKNARAVMGAIEWRLEEIVDRLTPGEWQELSQRLSA